MAKRTKQRSVTLSLRLSEEMDRRFWAFCQTHKLTRSEALRRLAASAGGFPPPLEDADRALLAELTRQIQAVGVNLNQMVRALNRGDMVAPAALEPVLQGVMETIDEVLILHRELGRRQRRFASRGVEGAEP